MTILDNLDIRGTLECTPPIAGKPAGRYVFQRTRPGHGNVLADPTRSLQCRIWTAGTNPRTQGQQTNRAAFAAAVLAWHSLSPPELAALRAAANDTNLNAYQLFLKRRMAEFHGA